MGCVYSLEHQNEHQNEHIKPKRKLSIKQLMWRSMFVPKKEGYDGVLSGKKLEKI
jgi:hypothetical protein